MFQVKRTHPWQDVSEGPSAYPPASISEINQCRNVLSDVIVCLSDKVYYTAAASNVVSLVHLVWIQCVCVCVLQEIAGDIPH